MIPAIIKPMTMVSAGTSNDSNRAVVRATSSS